MESREERIKIFTENVNKKNVESRCLEVATNGKVFFGKEKISLNGIIVGIKVPFDDLYSLDFYNGNCELVTLDIDLEKDLNNDMLRLRTSINTMGIKDKGTLDNNYNLIKKLDIFSFNVFGENADLTVENMQAIAKIINEICQKGNVLDNVMQKLTENN